MRYADGGGLTTAGRVRRESVRMQAAELFEQGVRPPEVARRLRVSGKSAYQWHQLWRESGVGALGLTRSEWVAVPAVAALPGEARRVPGPGAGCARLGGGPSVDRRTGGHADRAEVHVSYSISGATRLMHRLGFSPQVPARRVAERDDQAVSVWREATWAEVEEPGQPVGATSASLTKQASPADRPKAAPGADGAAPRS
ncbi:winged helix-turn-helix domain-containing protein [Kitasatospora sp. NPDC058965]|uniref:winged helix-turn-helix domain-containing protein n=1 Tax=Kitasatospora sp. NPDC058965 TaxID=3346682 RepID=UPI0036C2898D